MSSTTGLDASGGKKKPSALTGIESWVLSCRARSVVTVFNAKKSGKGRRRMKKNSSNNKSFVEM